MVQQRLGRTRLGPGGLDAVLVTVEIEDLKADLVEHLAVGVGGGAVDRPW
ncbi:hypothetical protein [Glycomyces sp. MUSA5-2]